MVKARVPETNEGIQGQFDVELFNQFNKYMRDRGWIETKGILSAGLTQGKALEIGPGPGIKGLEWLKHTTGTYLTAYEISQAMIDIAKKNAREYGLSSRVEYIHGNAVEGLPFPNNTFDCIFSTGSLHEWERPVNVLNETYRLLKPGGRMFISDLRRDLHPVICTFFKLMAKPKEIRPGFVSSLNASYTAEELTDIMAKTPYRSFKVKKDFEGVSVVATK